MYSTVNFQTKKALRDAVDAGHEIGVYQPNDMFGNPAARPDFTGRVAVEGPHYPQPHKWYATCIITNGRITKVL